MLIWQPAAIDSPSRSDKHTRLLIEGSLQGYRKSRPTRWPHTLSVLFILFPILIVDTGRVVIFCVTSPWLTIIDPVPSTWLVLVIAKKKSGYIFRLFNVPAKIG